jgi:hypothetical protein
MKDAVIVGALIIITYLIGATTLSTNAVQIETGPAYHMPGGSGFIQWFDDTCQPVGTPVFVPLRIDPYVKGRVVDSMGSTIRGPSHGRPSSTGCERPLGKGRSSPAS